MAGREKRGEDENTQNVLMSFRAIERLTLDAFMEFRKTNSSKKKIAPF